MNEIIEQAVQNAKNKQFQLAVNTPTNLKSYFLNEVLGPVIKEVCKINSKFYNIENRSNESEIRLVEKSLLIQCTENEVKFAKWQDDQWKIIQNVFYNNDRAEIDFHGSRIKLSERNLEKIIKDSLI